jgi:hypothetical protein
MRTIAIAVWIMIGSWSGPDVVSLSCRDQYAVCLQSGASHAACKAQLAVCKLGKR